MDVQIEHNSDELLEKVNQLKAVSLRKARRTALFSVGEFANEEIRDYIASAGDGSWDEVHPFTKIWEKQGKRFVRRSNYKGPYNSVRKAIRFEVEDDANSADVGVIKKKEIETIFSQMQENQEYEVSDSLRRKFGATRRSRDDVSGRGTFFPITSDLEKIKVSARPVIKPVFRKIKVPMVKLFEKAFNKTLEGSFQ